MTWVVPTVAVLLLALLFLVCLVLQPTMAAARRAPAVEPDVQALKTHVHTLVTRFRPRGNLDVVNLNAAANHIRGQFQALGLSPTEQTFQTDGETYRNVVARLGNHGGPLLVVGAHYDTCMGNPGADDNASGVAGLLELARLLVKHPPACDVELVAWTLEEPPHFQTPNMGSAHHANMLRANGVTVRVAVSLEMIGYFSDAPGSQKAPLPWLTPLIPSQGNFIGVVGDLGQGGVTRAVKRAMRAASPLRVVSVNAPRWVPGVDFSDHRNYWALGWPAVMITDSANNRNPHYHQQTDLPETLDYVRMGQVVAGVFEAVHVLAGR